MSDHEDGTRIDIRLPLPLDVTSALITAIGATWPEAVIVTDAPKWGSDDALSIRIPRRAPKRPNKRKMADFLAEVAPTDDQPEVELGRLTGDGAKLRLDSRDEAWQQLAAWAYTVLTGFDAPNYVEQPITVETPEGGHRQLVVIAAWSPKQTPHELRLKAEAALERLRGGQAT